jgi:DNA-binding NarL/FixJ family response regulator
VAAAEPAPLDAMSTVVAGGPLAAAERAGVLVTERSRRRMLVRCAHPLHAAALRERAAPSAVRAGLAVLADAMEARGARRADDPVRVGLWLLDAGRASRPALLTTAAARAHAHGHVLLAERLARAAVDAGGGDDARLVLHESLIWQARVTEADAIAPVTADDEESRALLAGARVDAFLVGVESYDSVVAGLDAADVAVCDPPLRAELAARRAGLELAATGNTAAAIEPWDAHGGGPPIVTLRLAFGAAPALAAAGRTDDAIAVAQRGLDALQTLPEPLSFAAEQLAASSGFAYLLAGRLDDADMCVLGAYGAAVRAGDRYAQALLAVPAAELDLWRGRVRAGARRAAEAIALTDGVDRMGFRPWAAALREYAVAWLDEPTAADDRVLLDGPWPHSGEFLHAFGRLSRARAALARGEASAAAELAGELADLAEARGQPAVAALAHHVAARAGSARETAAALARLASECDGALVPLLAQHALALAAGDAEALEATSERAAAIGLLPLAAEAAARAAALYHEGAQRVAAGRAGAARRALESAVDAPLHYPFPTAGAPTLTRRELEVARLAARGFTNATIADRLGVSVRTVHTHLQAAYVKLGTNDRAALTGALAAAARG